MAHLADERLHRGEFGAVVAPELEALDGKVTFYNGEAQAMRFNLALLPQGAPGQGRDSAP